MDFLDFLQTGPGMSIVIIAVPILLGCIYFFAKLHKEKIDSQQLEQSGIQEEEE